MSERLIQAFGMPGDGPAVLDYVLQKIELTVKAWNSELDVIQEIIKCLKGLTVNKLARDRMLSSGMYHVFVIFSYFWESRRLLFE